jgi:hypothetical protein
MKTFSSDDLVTFLRAVDEELDEPFRLLIIGGGAANLAYGITSYTRDIDTLNTEQFQLIDEIAKIVRKKTGLDIPISEVSVSDAPYYYEDRLISAGFLNLQKLDIYFPEKHDLVLMKIIRGDAHDFRHIKEIAEKVGLEYSVLSDRFLNEMSHVVCSPHRLRLNFLFMVENLFGEKKAEETEKRIAETNNWLILK